ncbi:gliding motility-associated C-terminal domain-containing protein [Mucilaginibacter sp.]|uniref:gliding motility-associated C-terminal domain-containing protein n=1 Tax=Mucilaginibacter sp. TaxID=1882438 RepID=UPI0025CE65D9|nr:gliding motility-associated C-terminal domain-containing protein [Mucilaginibacter sp.]
MCCFSFKAFPAVFVVTSNADSGPGTLREALTLAAANGSATTDYINFNLPGTTEAARTITLLSELPYLSSNLVIDGSTQPGNKISPGDAKVIINNDPNFYYVNANTAGFTIQNVQDVAIYGLSMNQFDGRIIQTAVWVASAISIIESKNIVIGAPGKGNMFDEDEFAIFDGTVSGTNYSPCLNIKIQSNVFGVVYPTVINLYCDGLLFGGDGALEGNHVSRVLNVSGSNVRIIHNYLGVDVAGNVIPNDAPEVTCSNGSNIEIRDNVSNNITMRLNVLSGFMVIGNNDIGINNYIQAGVHIFNCSDGTIGSEDITRQNVFHGEGQVEINASFSKNIKLLKNSIRCSSEAYTVGESIDGVVIPDIKVLVNSDTEYSGTASPGSTVYIYEDNSECPICNPVLIYTEVIADAGGKWKVTGNFKDKKMISNTLLNQNSSQFTTVRVPISANNGVITQPTCGKNNGSIALNEVYNALIIDWYNLNNEKVGGGPKLDKVGEGNYYAVARNGNCSVRTDVFALYNSNPKIYDNSIKVTQPSCGQGGSITGLTTLVPSQNPITYTWTDDQNKVVGYQTDITGLGAGKYTFTLRDETAGCEVSYGPVILKNASGPNINQSGTKIQPANCGQTTGSITNIGVTGTGTLQYIWWNSQQQQVGTSKDLTGQPAGTYKLQVLDDTQCGPVYTTDITIPEINGITLDESNVTTSIASCSQNNGSIKGISFSDATKFQWTDVNNQVVSSTADFTGAAPGVYTFTASNNFGCSKTSQQYTVGQQAPVQLPQYAATTLASCFGGKTGSVTVATDGLVKTLRWVDGQGGPAGEQPALTNVAAGTYKLYITDQNGCENLYNTYTVEEAQAFKVASTGQTTSDQCGLNIGSVNNVSITGGVPPYTYKWTDATGKQVGFENSVGSLAAGNYVLNVTDTRCGNVDIPYTITKESAEVATPLVSDVQLCSSGSALLSVNNASADITYRLYETGNSAHQIDEQKGGKFNINVTANRSYFVTQLTGTCESPRAEVKITVGLSTLDIANAFTPNGDGVNDYWKISNIESYPGALVQVFSRYGQKVFESKGYTKPFDGTMNGKKLPPGVYYYVINLNTNCNVLSGSLTLIR